MAWSDIDFSKIVAGSIANGDTEASWADILTEFITAARERSFSIGGYSPPWVNNTFAYIDSEGETQYGFQKGAIVNQGASTLAITFKNKIQRLINMYRLMYYGDVADAGRKVINWVKDDYDFENIRDYYLTDADFEELLTTEYGEVRGLELVDIFDNPWGYKLTELFNADVINCLYLIYSALNNYYSTLFGFDGTYSSAGYADESNIYYQSVYSLWGNYGSVTNFLNVWIGGLEQSVQENNNTLRFGSNYGISTDSGGVRYQRQSGTGNLVQDNVGISIVKYKLDNTTVTPVYKYYWSVDQNFKRALSREGNTWVTRYEEAFTDMFPYVEFRGNSIASEGTPKSTTTSDGIITEKFYILQDSENLATSDFPQPYEDTPIQNVRWSILASPWFAIIEANNAALDYYIPPTP